MSLSNRKFFLGPGETTGDQGEGKYPPVEGGPAAEVKGRTPSAAVEKVDPAGMLPQSTGAAAWQASAVTLSVENPTGSPMAEVLESLSTAGVIKSVSTAGTALEWSTTGVASLSGTTEDAGRLKTD